MHRAPKLLATALAIFCMGVLGSLTDSWRFGVSAADAPALSGTITSTGGEKMEGVTVSARAAGTSMTTSVFTDLEGVYYFPPLDSGKYKVWAQAQGFDAGRADVAVGATGVRQDFVLKPLQEFEAQLSGDVWYAALPETTREDKRMKEVFRLACMGCHSQNFTLITRFDQKGWKDIITVMSRIGSYGYGDPVAAAKRPPNPLMVRFGDSLAAYLAKVRGPGPSPMKFTPRRPKGDSTLMVVREYDGPEPGFGLPLYNDGSDWSQGAPDFMDEAHHHTMNATLDHDGNVWVADIFNLSHTVVKIDWKTGKATNFSVTEPAGSKPAVRGRPLTGVPANSHDIFTDDDGIVWFDLSSIGALGRADPKTGKVEALYPPNGARVGAFIGHDGKDGVWVSAGGGGENVDVAAREESKALRYDKKTQQWKPFTNPVPNAATYGMTGDRNGNGWWSTSNPTDGLIKADMTTGKSSLIAVPQTTNNRSELFTREELAFFQTTRLGFTGSGKPGAQAIRKPGADRKNEVVWGPGWFGALVKVNTRTNEVTTYPYPQGESNANAYEVSVDSDGMVWAVFIHDDMIGKFNPKTEKWTPYYLPTVGIKSHGLAAVTVNGRTQIGMGYLGVGKVAKLEFRTPEEVQALRARAPR